jgi:uncharacterized protein (TIGR02996 family)
MLAHEVQHTIRPVLSKWCRAHGFRLTRRGGLGWYHPIEDHFFVIGFRVPRRWNQHWGGFLECQLSVQDQINPWIGTVRPALTRSVVSLVSAADRETMRCWYNEAAARTTIPEQAGEPLTEIERRLAEMLRVPLTGPLSDGNEFLMRFHTADDVRRWATFILERLPDWFETIKADWLESHHATIRHDEEFHRPFLDAIRAEPESDALRLTYADWLAERGDPWAEVIRIQCRYPDRYMPWETADWLEELLDAHKHRWDRGADDLGVFVRFWRGMVEEVDCSAARFLQVGQRLLETFPLVHVLSICKVQGRGARLASQPALSAARTVSFGGLTGDDGEQIVRSPHLARVKTLRVAFPRDIDLAWLLDMPLARQLRVLDLSGSQLAADAPAWFGQTDAASALETLLLDNTGMDDEMARKFSEVATLHHLKRLSLAGNCRLGRAGIAAILQAEFAPRLESLRLDGDRFDESLVQQLVESPLSSTIRLCINWEHGHFARETIAQRFPNWTSDERFRRVSQPVA